MAINSETVFLKLLLTRLKSKTLLACVFAMTALMGWVVNGFPSQKNDFSFWVSDISINVLAHEHVSKEYVTQEHVKSNAFNAFQQRMAKSASKHSDHKNCHSTVRRTPQASEQSQQSTTVINHSIHQSESFVHKVHQMNDGSEEKMTDCHENNSNCCDTKACECPEGYCQSFTVIVQNFSITDSMLSTTVLSYQPQLLLAHSDIPFRPPIFLS